MKAAAVLHRLRVCALLGCLLPPVAGQAAMDAFVNFGSATSGNLSVVGESQDATYPGAGGWIQVAVLDDGILNNVIIGSGAGGAGAGKAKFGDLKLLKTVDAASPSLFSACARGLHFGSVHLVLRRAPGVFYTALLETVFIRSINWAGSNGDDKPTESLTLAYGKSQWTYTPFTSNGKPGRSQTVNWDVIDNTGGFGFLPGLGPTATSPTYARSPGLSLKIPVADIASDPSGLPLTVSLGTSSHGASLSTDNTFIFYLPANDDPDSFNYTVDNGEGGTATGTVTVQVVKPGGTVQTITSAAGTVTLNFAGIPGFQYDVQFTSDLSGTWTTVATFTAPLDGLFTFTEKPRGNPAFYRLVQH
jgi:type VI secretion system secreted protein Hcp